MKPRNKFEAHVVALSQVIQKKKLTIPQKKWGLKTTMPERYFTTHYNKFVCLECNHLFKTEVKDEKCTCPSCKQELEFNNYVFYKKEYFGIYDVVEGVQVHRIFSIEKHMDKKKLPEYIFSEVMQHWINDKGKVAVMSKKANSMGYYYDAFQNGTDLEIINRSVNRARLLQILDNYPQRNIMPILTRNGFVPDLIQYHPLEVMERIIKDRYVEFLLKLKQYDLVELYMKRNSIKESVRKYKNQIRIATKHGYIIKKCGDYFDYLDLLVFFNKDINNPFYICPENFTEAHDSLVRVKSRLDAAKDKEALQSEFRALDKKYKRRMKKFLDINTETNDLVIKVPQTVEDFYDAGVDLKHCIYTNKYYDKKNSLLLFTYKDGQVVETTEVDIKSKEILQSRGFKNKETPYNHFIMQTIQQNILPLI